MALGFYRILLWCGVALLTLPGSRAASFFEYIWPTDSGDETALDTFPSVPYELSDGEEDFIREASKWIGMNLSKLDMCHHRVILKLKKSCHELNAEQMGKLAVMMLNCQSDSEGRQVYACTEEMSLKQCTELMDPDTWNAYHLITNRAKAVCASVRHEQFRGLTELTVNKLMNTAHEQIRMMGQLADSQRELQSVTQEAVEEMAGNNARIINQQGDIMKLSETHRAKIESNFRDLVREKGLIRAGQQEVAILLTDLRSRIDESIKQLELQTKRSKLNHDSLLTDLERLQSNAAELANKIDETGSHVAEHHRVAEEQYGYTLTQLQRINATIGNLLEMIDVLQKDFNRQLAWITEKIGGSEDSLHKLHAIAVHICYLLVGMICLAFVGADKFIRIFFISAVPANLLGTLLGFLDSNIVRLTIMITSFIAADGICRIALRYMPQEIERFRERTRRPTPTETVTSSQHHNVREEQQDEEEEEEEAEEEITYLPAAFRRESYSRERSMTPMSTRRSVTPASNRSYVNVNYQRQQCVARTVRGEQCRGFPQPDSEYCRIHTPRGL